MPGYIQLFFYSKLILINVTYNVKFIDSVENKSYWNFKPSNMNKNMALEFYTRQCGSISLLTDMIKLPYRASKCKIIIDMYTQLF